METIRQIIDSLAQPDRDPREDFSPPNFRSDVLTIKDVKTGKKTFTICVFAFSKLFSNSLLSINVSVNCRPIA